jgi:8-amino-7-oxononanoate synthase
MEWLTQELQQRQAEGLQRRKRTTRLLPDGWCEVDARRLRNFASNDYLNLAHDSRLIAAAQDALTESGVGATASALICGRTVWHDRLETALAKFEQQPAALIFPTGMAANAGTIAALAGEGDVIFSDRLNHASLVQGCRLSGAALRIYRHTELDRLETVLGKANGYRRRFVVTDAVFSMDGDLAPLPQLCDLAERHAAHLIVDEAHGTGVFGAHGRGVCEHFGVEERVAVRIGTLSKALGTLGGFVSGPQTLIDYLWNTARTQIYSTALPPAICAAATIAIEILHQHPEYVHELSAMCAHFRGCLARRNVPVLAGSMGPIVPIVVGEPERTMQVAARLEELGYLVGAIRPPTVPAGTARLRISLTRAHATADLEQFANVLADVLQPAD